MVRDYVESVAADRPTKARGLLLLVAVGLLFFAWIAYYAALEPIPWGSAGWETAERARRFARMGWALFFAMLGLWLMAKTARSWLALPPANRAGARWFVWGRNILTGVLLIFLIGGLHETIASPYPYPDHRLALGGSAGLVWFFFAVDLVPLVRRAVASLRARVSALAFKRSTVGGTEAGRVRIEGTIALGERAVSGGLRRGKLVYRHRLDEDGQSIIDIAPFLLESEGHRLFVDVVAAETIVVPAHAFVTEIGEGDKVEVWGSVTRPDDAFRGQPSRMSPGKGRLYVFQGSRSLNRRLTLAALVELLASASFLAIGVGFAFYVFDLYIFLI